ncbi:MAG: hypothetical protein ACFKPT_12125 [Gloeotrichia echinulata GP01]
MNTHKIEVVLTEDGTLTLRGLPFHAGEAVEVIIQEAKTPQHQAAPKPQSDKNLYPLHDTQPYQYDDPTEPVALHDCHLLTVRSLIFQV